MTLKEDNPLHGKQWRKGRGYTKHTYTLKDVAEMTGRAVGTVRNDLCKKKIDISDVRVMVDYVNGYLKKRILKCGQCAK